MSTDNHLEIVEVGSADESVEKIKTTTSAAVDEKASKTFKTSDKENCNGLLAASPKAGSANLGLQEVVTSSSTTVRLGSQPAAAGQDATDGIDHLDSGTDLKVQSYNNGSHGGKGVFKIIKTLGKGNFAKVKLALHLPTGREVAIKVIDKTQLNASARQKLYREVRIMKLLNHPNIVRLFQVIESERTLYLIMEYASRGELFDHLVKNGRMRERDARVIFRQLVSAIQYCHSKFVVHRDLKAENLLLDQHMNIKIADFGFGNTFDPNAQLETFCGSPPYAAPELFMGRKYAGPEVDAWSLGVVLYTLVSGSLPFDGGTLKELRERVLRGKYRVPYYISMDCETLMRKFLVLNPGKRTSLNAVMSDKWINLGHEESDRLRPYVEKPMEMQDPVRQNLLAAMGYKRRDIETSLKTQAFDDIYCSYMLLGVNKPRSGTESVSSDLSVQNSATAVAAAAAAGAAAPSPHEKNLSSTNRPLPPRVVNVLSTASTSGSPGTGGATVGVPPAKPTRRTPARKTPTSNHVSNGPPHTPTGNRLLHTPPGKRTSSINSGGPVDVKPTLLSTQRQQAHIQKMTNTPPRFYCQGSGRRPTTLYEKAEPSTPGTPVTTRALPKSPMDARLLERLQSSNGQQQLAVASATPMPSGAHGSTSTGPSNPIPVDRPSDKHFTRSNVARATFHFGQGRTSSKHGRGTGNSEDDGYQVPPHSADDTKPPTRVGFFTKLTARFGRRVIHLNEKDSSEQRKNLTK